ncbi:MAG TPA: hypothetical protein VHA15_00325 [Burkholderiales bacterium]|jgi:hypothetical protein|nr:hypothetical protein [Burkholderiales bacterium]
MKGLSGFSIAIALWLGLALPARAAGIEITSPVEGTTVHDNAGNVSVTARLDGEDLPPGARLRFLLDGQPAAPDTSALSVALAGIARGEHVLEVRLLDDSGRVVAASAPVTFHMWQASRRNPASRRR